MRYFLNQSIPPTCKHVQNKTKEFIGQICQHKNRDESHNDQHKKAGNLCVREGKWDVGDFPSLVVPMFARGPTDKFETG